MASKLLLNALKAKIVSNPFSTTPPPAGQQDDGSGGQAAGDFHLTPVVYPPASGDAVVGPLSLTPLDAAPAVLVPVPQNDPVPPPPPAISPAPQSVSAPPVVVTVDDIPPASIPPVGPGGPVAAPLPVTPEPPSSPLLNMQPVAASTAVVFPQLTLETDHEAEDLAAQVKVLEGQKRRLTFKRSLPRVAGFVVVVMASLSGFAFSGSPMPDGSVQTNLSAPANGQDMATGAGKEGESIAPMRYFIAVGQACPMDAPVRTKLQQQLREETNGLTLNEAIAYWVFACGHDLEAYVDRGFGPWAVEQGIVSEESAVDQPLTRAAMQKVFATKMPPIPDFPSPNDRQ